MTERVDTLKRYISFPIWELSEEWFYVEGPTNATWLHICRPHYWKDLEIGPSNKAFERLKFSSIPFISACHACKTPVPDHLVKLSKLLSLGKEIS